MTENKDITNESVTNDMENEPAKETTGEQTHTHHTHHSHHSSHGSHSHHSSHGSSGHSSHRRSSKKKKKQTPYNKVPLDKKTILKICGVVAVVALVLAVLLIINHIENKEDTLDYIGEEEIKFNGDFVIAQRPFVKEVDVIDQVAKEFFESGAESDLKEKDKNDDGEKAYDVSSPVVLTPEIYNIPEGLTVYGYLVDISRDESFSSSDTYIFKYGEEIEIYNLRNACKYYYRVSLISTPDAKDLIYTYSGSFKTSDTPRILSVDGINNVRDIGGWKTNDGKRIRQGLLYRGTELDGIVQAKYRITEEGIYTLTEILDIKYEMDLRGEHENPTGVEMLDPYATHKYYGVNMYKGIFTDEAKVSIKNVFSDLADPDKYPIYMHCTYGMDRTGTICYLLEALLGMSDEDILTEYKLSKLHYSGMPTNEFETTLIAMSAYEGSTTQEKVESYLLECGVTAEEIASIREIFLVDEELYNAE